MARKKRVALAMEKPVKLWIRNDMDPKNLTIKTTLDHSLLDNNAIIAPVHKNEKIGTVSVALAQDTLGYVQEKRRCKNRSRNKSAVEKASTFELIWQKITGIFA